MRQLPKPRPPKAREALSNRLALARDLIQRHRRKDALEVLDALLPQVKLREDQTKRKAQISALAGDYEFKRGHFAKAVEYYQASYSRVGASSELVRDWFRPAFAEVAALIALPDVEQAFDKALQFWKRALSESEQFTGKTNITLDALKQKKRMEIGPRPIRPSVVASRLGELFRGAGESEMAEFFFNEAILVNPNGGCRARQALAKLSLVAGDYEQAESRAREALLLGKYQAKTVSAWPLLLKARSLIGKQLISDEDVAAIDQVKFPSIRARTILVVCREMRKLGNGDWVNLANKWIASEGNFHPEIVQELKKLFLAESKLTGGATREDAAMVLKMIRSKDVAPYEAISAAKHYMRISLQTEEVSLNWLMVFNQIKTRYNHRVAMRALHGMALEAALLKRLEVARTLLTEILKTAPETGTQWGRSAWALVRLALAENNAEEVYALCMKIARNKFVPVQFRDQAFIRALRMAPQVNVAITFEDKSWLHDRITNEADYVVLLNLGRQLSLAGPNFREFTEEAARQACYLVEEQLESVEHPAEAIALLLHLTRRQLHDFHQYSEILRIYKTYAEPKLNWLWSASCDFWEWYGLVVTAKSQQSSDVDTALQMAHKYLNDPGTPREGLSILAAQTGRMLVANNRQIDALEYFQQATDAQSSSVYVGVAHYWWSVFYYAQGYREEALQAAWNVRACYNRKPALLEHWQMDARAALLLVDMDIQRVLADASNTYSEEFLSTQQERMVSDISIF